MSDNLMPPEKQKRTNASQLPKEEEALVVRLNDYGILCGCFFFGSDIA